MMKTVAIGLQSFEDIRTRNIFYVDKTNFIREWWESEDAVTLITRPRRFGKTLNMSMMECFFSNRYADRGDLFEGLSIWEDEKYRKLQGTYPVIFMSFAPIKTGNAESMKIVVKQIISNIYDRFRDIMKSEQFSDSDRAFFDSVNMNMPDEILYTSINQLCIYLEKYYGKKAVVLLDEYDTPMQEAWLAGNWDDAAAFFRSFFNATFKTNPNLQRAIITGITRISKESIFSDLNNLKIVTVSSETYAECFGFTESEVFDAMDEYGLSDQKQVVKQWYDGFTFGRHTDIYNPWSIINYLDERKLGCYWVNTSSNGLVNQLMRKGDAETKMVVEDLIRGKSFSAKLDEQIVFSQLDENNEAVWSLLLASGYLKIMNIEVIDTEADWTYLYTLSCTNKETRIMFSRMVSGWFNTGDRSYNYFIKALLANDVESMNEFMNNVALRVFSCFDSGNGYLKSEPERFYHGFVLGLMVDLSERYVLTSNRESGFGRYDIMLEPKNKEDNAYIIEFKVHKPAKEKTLEDTVAAALAQIEEKKYDTLLIDKGVPVDKIYKYGFAFEGKCVQIG